MRKGGEMDASVLVKAKAGDRSAFGEITETYYKDAYLFALSMTGSVHDAMDVCQDAFIKAYRNIGRLKDDEKLKNWLIKIVANTANDLYRSSRSKETPTEDLYEVFTDDSLTDRFDLFSALMKLKAEYRQVLVLRYFNDIRISDVGKILKIPENTVKSRTRYALEQMKRIMEVK
jgi:RNA polymerase sigma-70 factor, ECF subfamily